MDNRIWHDQRSTHPTATYARELRLEAGRMEHYYSLLLDTNRQLAQYYRAFAKLLHAMADVVERDFPSGAAALFALCARDDPRSELERELDELDDSWHDTINSIRPGG